MHFPQKTVATVGQMMAFEPIMENAKMAENIKEFKIVQFNFGLGEGAAKTALLLDYVCSSHPFSLEHFAKIEPMMENANKSKQNANDMQELKVVHLKFIVG